MRISIVTLLIVSVCLSFISCIEIREDYNAMIPGKYRGVLLLSENPYVYYDEDSPAKQKAIFEGISDSEIPFNFEISYTDEREPVFTIKNAEERIKVTNISYGTDRSTSHDTMRIKFPEYNAYLYAEYAEDAMQGYYLDKDKPNIKIPFNAYHGELHRFSDLPDTPKMNIDGRWKVTFTKEDGSTYPAIGQFQQDGNKLTGTFAKETGDYRFLEGIVQGKKMWLSTFDGSHLFLFGAKMVGKDSLEGYFKSGKTTNRTWSAIRDNNYKLSSPDSLTQVANPDKPIDFCFLSSEGDSVCLDDPTFAGRPKIIQIMGSWCPNCKDEIHFLNEYFKNNPDNKTQVIALSIESNDSQKAAIQDLKQYKDKMNISYPVLLAGNTKNPTANLPFLNQIKSYPTMIFLDKNNKVQGTHTGFYGPATEEYEKFKKSFDRKVQSLSNQ